MHTTIRTLSLTHDDAMLLLDTASLTRDQQVILNEAIAEAEEAAICDDVFIDVDDLDTEAILAAVAAAGLQHQVH